MRLSARPKSIVWATRIALAALAGLASSAFAIGSITSTGSLPRDSSRGYFDLTVVVKDVLPSDVALKPKEKTLNDRISILLPDVSSSEALGTDSAGTASVAFYIEFRDDASTAANTSGNFDLTFYPRIHQVNQNGLTNLMNQSADKKTVKLRFKYTEDQTQKGDPVDTTVVVNPTVANEAPENLQIVASHKLLSVTFDKKSSIAFVGASDAASTGSPTDATVISFRLGVDYPALPAKVFSPSSESDSSTTCTFNPDLASGGACVTCPDKSYLDVASLATLDTENIKVKSAANGSRDISGLENDVSYAVVAMYQPDGVQRSLCLTATPSKNVTLTELNGEGEATEVNLRCFVATAAYGSPLHKNLRALRWFRDGLSGLHPAGNALVETYYRASPAAAAWISQHPRVAMVVRAALWVPALTLDLAMNAARDAGVSAAAAVGSMLVAFVLALAAAVILLVRRARPVARDVRA